MVVAADWADYDMITIDGIVHLGYERPVTLGTRHVRAAPALIPENVRGHQAAMGTGVLSCQSQPASEKLFWKSRTGIRLSSSTLTLSRT